jgi:hypothetical protein
LNYSGKQFLSRFEAARLLTEWGLKTAQATLAGKASRGGSPPYFYYGGRVYYEASALRAWALTSRTASSTTEHAAKSARKRAAKPAKTPETFSEDNLPATDIRGLGPEQE